MKPILLVAVLIWPALALTACSDPTMELYNAAVELQEQGRLYEAIAEYDKVLKMDPQFAEAYRQRGLANASLRQNELAIQDYDNALQIDPESHETYFNRGKLYELGFNPKSAIEDYSQAIRLMPESSDYFHRRANVYARHGQVDLALADYAEAIRLNEVSAIYVDRGRFHGNLSKKQKALDDFTEAIRLDASNEEAYAMRAVWNAIIGNDTAAQRDLEKAVKHGYDRPLLEASIEQVKSLR